MDSKLVVEQMSGRWKIKHADMQPLALEANRLAPSGTTYTWVPREQNTHADRLANEALDGKRDGVTVPGPEAEPESLIEEIESPSEQPQAESGQPRLVAARRARRRRWSWSGTASPPTPRRSGSPAASRAPTPGSATRDVTRSGRSPTWLAPLADRVDAVVTSPVRRTRESAEILAEALGHPLEEEPGFAEMEFGAWDGLTFAEVAEKHQADLDAWLGSLDTAPGGRASRSASVEERVLAGLRARPGRPRRQDRRRGQPRDPDQDPRRARGRRPADVAVPDGAEPGARSPCCRSSPAAAMATSRGPRCGCTTPCLPATTCSRPAPAGSSATVQIRAPGA